MSKRIPILTTIKGYLDDPNFYRFGHSNEVKAFRLSKGKSDLKMGLLFVRRIERGF